MPRVTHYPSELAWSFPTQVAPVNWNLPPGNLGGEILLMAVTAGSPPVNGQGAIFSVTFDGGAPDYVSACMVNGSDLVVVPPGTLNIVVTVVKGCNGGPTATVATVSGAGP